MNEIAEAVDAMQQYWEMEARRRALRAPRLPPAPTKPSSVEPWRPVMTEQQRAKHEQYVKEQNLPF